MVKISVIIPIYNAEKYLNECLDSICTQTLNDIEIICVNDGSTDSSLKILEEYEKNDDRLVIISQTNKGSAISKNNGVDIARGEYIGFLDADDIYIDSKSLEMMYNAGKDYGSEMISGNLKFISQKRKIIPCYDYEKGNLRYFENNCEIMPDDYGIPFYFCKSLFKADLIKDIRFQNLPQGEDTIFLSEVLSKIERIYAVNVDFYGHMVPAASGKPDTYTKKYNYILQYRQCIDILNDGNLVKTSDKYMHNLIIYLTDNADEEVYDIVCDVFDEDMNYFKNYKKEYDRFRRFNISNKILSENSEEYYQKAKTELNLEYNTLSEYKIGYFKAQHDSKQAEYDGLVSENERLKEEYEREKSFNDEITNSRSWKLMNKFRKLRG